MNNYETNKKDFSNNSCQYLDLTPYGIDDVYNLHFLQYKDDQKLIIKCHTTNQTANHVWFYRFKDMTRAIEKIKQTIENQKARIESKQKRKAERSQPHNVKVGDTFVCSWGYDQTNIDFYKVIKLIGKNTCEIIPTRGKIVSSEQTYDNFTCETNQTVEFFETKGITKRIAVDSNGRPSIKIYSFAWAYPTEKDHKDSQTNSLFGH